MNKKLLIALIVIVSFIALLIGYIAWSSSNKAKIEAENVLGSFATATKGQWYCENGSGKGTDNQTPWWEEIYVSNSTPEETTRSIEQHLKNKGYSAISKYIENSQDSYNQGKSYWELEGKRSSYSVQSRISSKVLTLNNCFKGFSNMDESINPESYNSVIVIQFKSES